MSRKIDLTKPLSEEDREYLELRDRKYDLLLNQQYLDEGKASAQQQQSAASPDDGMKDGDDPSDFSVAEVNAYLESLDQSSEEYSRVWQAEENGKARKGILED